MIGKPKEFERFAREHRLIRTENSGSPRDDTFLRRIHCPECGGQIVLRVRNDDPHLPPSEVVEGVKSGEVGTCE